jgi:beta-galactosidase
LNADGEDGCVISVTVEDAMGNTVPDASNQIVFEISGPGQIIGVGNGDPNSREADKAATRQVFHGLACAIVQADRTAGEIQVMASSHGLASASLAIRTVDCELRPAL